jgi:polysaccharide transporter, PST family
MASDDTDEASDPKSPLSRRAARGAAQTAGAQGARIASQVVSMVVLARLLNPSDFGLMAIVIAIVGFGELIRELGLSNAAIQARELPDPLRNTLFWINSGLGLALTSVALVFAPLVATIYGDPRLEGLLRVMAPVFLINGLATQYRAGLARALKFRELSTIDAAAPLIALAASVAAAVGGLGYWSLAIQQLAAAMITAIGYVSFGRWLPGRGVPLRSARAELAYGFNLLAGQLIQYVGRSSDVLIGATRLSVTEMGYYNRASSLVNVPLNQVNPAATRVAVPVLARLQDTPSRFVAYLLRGQTVLLHFTLLFLGLLTAFALPVVRIVLGPDWISITPLVQVIAIGSMAKVISYSTYWVALSTGLTRVSLIAACVSAPITALAAWIGAGFGTMGLAVAVAIAGIVSWAAAATLYRYLSDAPIGPLIRAGFPVVTTYVLAGSLGAWTWHLVASEFSWPVAAGATLLVFTGIVGLAALFWQSFRRSLLDAINARAYLRG